MQLKTFWFKKEMMVQSFRTAGWIGIIYLFGLFFALPLRILMEWTTQEEQNKHFYNNRYSNVFEVFFEVQLLLMIAIPILLAIFLFRYLQEKTASDFMHSLPIQRSALFNQYIGFGVMYLVIPIVANAVTLLFMRVFWELDMLFTVHDILTWAGVTFVVTLLIYLTGVFVGTITGMSVVQGVLTMILLLFPAGITGLVLFNVEQFMFGFVPNFYLEYNFDKLSPITNATTFVNYGQGGVQRELLSTLETITYLLVTLLLYGTGMWIYKKRNLERSSQAIVFRQLQPVFKYGMTLSTMLLSGLYFGETENSTAWTLFGYVIGSLVGYFVAEMLLQKTWRVFTHVKGWLAYAVVISFLGLCVHWDITGYQKRIPDLEEIERVYFGEDAYRYIQSRPAFGRMDMHKPYFKNPENIQTIRTLHQEIIIRKDRFADAMGYQQRIFIAYELKNGQKVVRQYDLPTIQPFVDVLKPIYNSKEYKEAEYEVLHVNPDEVHLITIRREYMNHEQLVISEPTKVADALIALKRDIMRETDPISTIYEKHESEITIKMENGQRIHMRFPASYVSFNQILKEQGKLQ